MVLWVSRQGYAKFRTTLYSAMIEHASFFAGVAESQCVFSKQPQSIEIAHQSRPITLVYNSMDLCDF